MCSERDNRVVIDQLNRPGVTFAAVIGLPGTDSEYGAAARWHERPRTIAAGRDEAGRDEAAPTRRLRRGRLRRGRLRPGRLRPGRPDPAGPTQPAAPSNATGRECSRYNTRFVRRAQYCSERDTSVAQGLHRHPPVTFAAPTHFPMTSNGTGPIRSSRIEYEVGKPERRTRFFNGGQLRPISSRHSLRYRRIAGTVSPHWILQWTNISPLRTKP